jgi:hypothetical protein
MTPTWSKTNEWAVQRAIYDSDRSVINPIAILSAVEPRLPGYAGEPRYPKELHNAAGTRSVLNTKGKQQHAK